MVVVAVMPAYNEEQTLKSVALKTCRYVDKLIIINDASTDSTGYIANKLAKENKKIIVIKHETNRGLGSSLRDGFAKALKIKADIIITIDADGQHKPEDIPRFINKIKDGYEFVIGARLLYKYPLFKKFGNFFLNTMTNFISGTKIKDTESGYRAFTYNALKKLVLTANKYEIATEIIYEVGRNRIKAINIPIQIPLYIKGVGVREGIDNFVFLMHRRKRSLRGYFQDFKSIIKRWID